MVAVRRILLVGMMGSGKSTVGRGLARSLGWPLLDNDALIREATGQGGPAIFRDQGEDALHRAERDALSHALERPGPAVITAAASVVDDPEARDRLRHEPAVVWLRASPGTLSRRIRGGGGRRADAVDDAWLAALDRDRAARYLEVADLVVDVDERTAPEAVDRIRTWIESLEG
jgi:shikimate kinase